MTIVQTIATNGLAVLWLKLAAGFVLGSCAFGLLSGLLSGDGIGWAMDRMGAYFLRSIYITLAFCVLAGLGWIVFYL